MYGGKHSIYRILYYSQFQAFIEDLGLYTMDKGDEVKYCIMYLGDFEETSNIEMYAGEHLVGK